MTSNPGPLSGNLKGGSRNSYLKSRKQTNFKINGPGAIKISSTGTLKELTTRFVINTLMTLQSLESTLIFNY